MSDRAIIESIKKIVGVKDWSLYCNAEVLSVDELNRTCNCIAINGQAEYELNDVGLMAVNDDGFLLIPTIGSTVKVLYSENVEPFICQYSAIDKIVMIANESIVLNGTSYGGLTKTLELKAQLAKLTARVDGIMAAIADPTLKASFPAFGTASTTANALPKEDFSNIENTNIKHGI